MALLKALQSKVTGISPDKLGVADSTGAVRKTPIQRAVSMLPTPDNSASHRQALMTERAAINSHKVYNAEQTVRNRARLQELNQELSMLTPKTESGRFKSGVQSILSAGLGAIPAIAATAKSLDWSIGEERNREESRQLAELDRKIRALEGSRRGDALDHIRGTDEWKALDAQRRALSLQANPAVDMDDPGMRLMRESNQYREQALEGLEGVPRFLGGTALSIGQNAALLPLAAVNPALPLAAMGTISAADKMYELGERGLPASEALSRGLISGGIEAATEKIPLDTLLDAMKTGGKGALRNILRQAGTEAGEESVSYLANYLVDKAYKDPKAEFSLAELAKAAAGGALSGGVFGGFGSAYNTVGERLNQPVALPVAEPVDRDATTGYDGTKPDRRGDMNDGRGEEATSAHQGTAGADVWGKAGGAEEAYPGRMGDVLEEGRGRHQAEGWARDHIVATPSQQAERASQNARQYIHEVFTVDDSALKARAPGAWALTSGGKIYISDSIPAELADVVGYHEVVHAIRQQGNPAYQSLLADEYPMLDHRGERTQDILDLVVESRFPGKNILDLTTEEALVAYDELNALVWGYYKADPNNARTQFAGVFRDYDGYIRLLDGVMEAGRMVETPPIAGPRQTQGPVDLPVMEQAQGQKNSASTGETDNSGILPFSAQEAQNLTSRKGVVNGLGGTSRQFIDNARNLGNTVRFYFGKASESLGTRIENAIGRDVSGYNIAIRSDEVLHAMTQHGNAAVEARRGQLPVTAEALERLPEVFDQPDEVVALSKKDYAGRTAFEIRKQLDGYMVAVVGVADGRHSIEIDSVYIINKKGSPTTTDATQEASPSPTSKTSSRPTLSSIPIIAQSAAGSNTESAQVAEGRPRTPPVAGDGDTTSVGAAPMGFDEWSHFQNQSGQFFPEGANAARPVDVPTTDRSGRNIRKTASTAMGARAIPDEVVGDIQRMVLSGQLSYDRVTDQDSIRRAVAQIEQDGFQRALGDFSRAVQKGVVSKDLATLGQQLLVNAANAGDGKATAELLSLYGQMETAAGQAVQAASILRKLDPSYQLYAAQKAVDRLQETLSSKLKGQDITIDPALIEKFEQQTDQAGRDAVLEEIYQNVADQVPATWQNKWNAWRYLAMLGNPRTHIRNIAGNAGFMPVHFVKDRVAALIEAGISAGKDGFQRTKSFVYDPKLYAAAWADYPNVAEALSGSKYDDIKSIIEDRRTIFQLKPLEAARRGNSNLLSMEDAIAKRVTYAGALAGYLNANGVTAEQLRAGTADPKVLNAARDYAGQEAQRATFNDKNQFSDAVVRTARSLGTLGEAVLPFKRTPANILVRGVEYSPLGLAKGLTYDLAKVKRGEMSATQAIDNIAAGLTGSALMALGALLAANGIVTGGDDPDEKQQAMNDLTGTQSYALNLPGGGSVTLDWLAPEALPFFMGAQLFRSLGENGLTAESITDALTSVSEPMLEMSMLQSLNDLIDNVSYAASNEKLSGLLWSSIVSYLTQAIPTLGGQLERSGEDVRMTTYTDKNLLLPTDAQYALGKASARLPGWDYQQIPYVDAWGRQEETGDPIIRSIHNLFNPAYTDQRNVTAVDEEVQRLYDQIGEGGVVPSRANRYIIVDGDRKELSKEEYLTYATEKGQGAYQITSSLLGRAAYKRLSDEEKAEAIQDAYTYADAVAKTRVSRYQPEGWVAKVRDSGIDPGTYILYRHGLEDGMSAADKSALMERSGITGRERTALLLAEYPDWAEDAEEAGVSKDVFVSFKVATTGLTGDKDESGKTISGSKKTKVLNAIHALDVDSATKDALYAACGYAASKLWETPWH